MKKFMVALVCVTGLFIARADVLVATNSTWKYFKGVSEASSPGTAWRTIGFNDASWPGGLAPFYYEQDPASPAAVTGNTALNDMRASYSCVFMRRTFVLTNVAQIAGLQLAARCDDGFIAWINGTEVARFNMPAGNVPYNGSSSPPLSEPVPFQDYVLSNPGAYLLPGTNVVAVQAFNSSLSGSSDFLIWLALSFALDTNAPTAGIIPAAGATVRSLTSVEVDFSESVAGVDAADLVVNGSPAASVTAFAPWQYVFEFPEPLTGVVQVAWSGGHGIADLAGNSFAGGNWSYTLDPNAPAPFVQISEFMAENNNTIDDEDGEPSDWIEIFNPTSEAVNINGWSLTDEVANLEKWRFPNVTIPANGYLLVFASDKNKTNATGVLHTNFKLSNGGEYLALVDGNGDVASAFEPAFPAQSEDVSYGRDRISPEFVGYFTAPTPGGPNTALGLDLSAPVQFSQSGKTFIGPFTLELATAATNAVIHYTLNGGAPTESSAIYANAISITNSVQVRARSFTPGRLPGTVRSESYIRISGAITNFTYYLPVVVINNFGAGPVPVSVRQFANITILEPRNGVTSLTNPPSLSARAGIHVRGSSTQGLPKQSWAVEFWDDFDDDKNYSPLGMPAESDWVLYAPNNFDPVLIHNPLAYSLSNDIGRYAPRTRLVVVFINTGVGPLTGAQYNGIYVLEEKIKWDRNRVDIDKLEPEDSTPPNVTGGYLMKIDRLGPGESGFNAAGQNIVYVDPGEDEIKTPQRASQRQYILNYMNAFGSVLNGANYKDPALGYRAYVDVESWIDHHILNVAMFNVDALRLSAFFYKERNGRLFFGPVWDFDRSLGSGDGRDFNPRIWRSPTADYGTDFFNYPWWGRMFTDIDFWQQWIDRYQELRTGVLSTNHLYARIEALANEVRQEQPREVLKWPSLTSPRSGTVSASGFTYNFPGTYDGEVVFLKHWFLQRLDFMDTNFLERPVFNNNGGTISPGLTLAMSGRPGATVYYTTNGSDPRLSGGGVSPNARSYSGPVSITTNVTIRARAYFALHQNLTGTDNPPVSTPWSGISSATFVVASPPVITQAPQSLEAYVGQSPTFTVQAGGSPTPSFRWQFNNTNLVGQTNSQLILPSVQTNQTGNYSLIVSNSVGSTNASFTLKVTPKPNLVITEVMSSQALDAGSLGTHDWWELSNLGDFQVNLRGFRFDDSSSSLGSAFTLADAVEINPGESIVFVETMSPAAFLAWWGQANMLPGTKIITYGGSGLGFSSDGDAVNLWNAAAIINSDKVASAAFSIAQRGVSFGYDETSEIFGGLSVVGQNGAFVAAANGDIGSPGTVFNLPRISGFGFDGQTGVDLTFVTQPGRNYRIEYKNSLDETNWLTLTNVSSAQNPLSVIDAVAEMNSSRFYRAVMLP